MEEKTKPVFVVATANNIERLPPELLRKGRLDEIFFVDLPTPHNRAQIRAIHLARRDRAWADFDIGKVAEATDGFSGAELEEVVVNALYEAFSLPNPQLKTEHLLNAAKPEQIKPLSQSRAEAFERLRNWADQNCRKASAAESGDFAGVEKKWPFLDP